MSAGEHEYLVGHIEDALARDERTSEQGIWVSIREDPMTVVVSGTVVAPRPSADIASVVHEILPEAEVRDETTVADYPEAADVEHVE